MTLGEYMWVEPKWSDRCQGRNWPRCRRKVVKVIGYTGSRLWRWPLCAVHADEMGAARTEDRQE